MWSPWLPWVWIEVTGRDAWGASHVLAHGADLLWAVSQAKLFTWMGKAVMSCWSTSLGKTVRAASSAKSISKWKRVTLCYWHEDRPGWIECHRICPLVGWRWRTAATRKRCRREWKPSGSLFFSPLLIRKGFEYDPSYWMVPCMSSWKDVGILRLGGHPIFCRGLKRPFLLTRSKALVRFMNATHSVHLCSQYASCGKEKSPQWLTV